MFEFLKRYIVDEEFNQSSEKHVFYRVKKEDITSAEKAKKFTFLA